MKISKTTLALSTSVLLCGAVAFAAEPKTTLFSDLGAANYTPDGMTVADFDPNVLYLNVPNFGRMDADMKKADSAQGGYLVAVAKDGSFKKVLDYPILKSTGQCGPMGLDFGPDGDLYVCDNQYFHSKDFQSRILRVVFKDGKATGEIQTVVEGCKLANGIVWSGDKMFYTDSCFDLEDGTNGVVGSGGLFMIDAKEATKAGRDGVAPIKVSATPDDPRCLAAPKVVKLGRGDNTGADGLAVDKNGVVWFGNFGNGFVYAVYPNADGSYPRGQEVVVFDATKQKGVDAGAFKGVRLECCDGMLYDAEADRVLINDSCNNAVWAFAPVAKGQKIDPQIVLINGDNDGMDGLLDQPCEACRFGDKMIFANFDWPFPGLKNSKVDPPGTLSGIDYAVLKAQYKKADAKK